MGRFYIKVDKLTISNGIEVGRFIATLLAHKRADMSGVSRPLSAAVRELERLGIVERRDGVAHVIAEKLWSKEQEKCMDKTPKKNGSN